MPPLSATKILLASQQLGDRNPNWADADTATGGQGQTIDGVSCASNTPFHIHSHVSIFVNGQQLAVPSSLGRVTNCDYELHTHDRSGVIHVEGPAPARFTLGQFFSVWGQALSNTQVAELTDPSIVVFINDSLSSSGPQLYSGDIREVEFADHREITIQIGTALPELQTYDWTMIGP